MLIDAARYNPNDEERLDLYRQAERRVIELACGVAPYWHESKHYLIKPELTGFKENATSQDAFLPGDWRAEAWGLAN
jgi:ABC-type oligopeptide transport system substrate-binding subunit